ncbi:MAG: hypothetical protein J2P37_28915, partial [Ktedonobacteraceae bacterium]|nr:hypothetical protein [Ktedonobacteraceae bacterium]
MQEGAAERNKRGPPASSEWTERWIREQEVQEDVAGQALLHPPHGDGPPGTRAQEVQEGIAGQALLHPPHGRTARYE